MQDKQLTTDLGLSKTYVNRPAMSCLVVTQSNSRNNSAPCGHHHTAPSTPHPPQHTQKPCPAGGAT